MITLRHPIRLDNLWLEGPATTLVLDRLMVVEVGVLVVVEVLAVMVEEDLTISLLKPTQGQQMMAQEIWPLEGMVLP